MELMHLLFIGIVVGLLWLDLYAHRDHKAISLRSATLWSLFYIAAALVFAGVLYIDRGSQAAALFITGWCLEKVLAFDNLMVFAAIFAYFKIQPQYQHRILHLGVIGAIVLRLVFVAVGVGAMHLIGPAAEIVFAAIILYTAYLMATADDNDVDYADTWYIRYTKKWLPVTPHTNGAAFFINGKATPLVFALIAVEISDIMFAFDSVPVIIAVTKEPFLIYSSMIFAILGLRSLYFVLAALMDKLVYLEKAVSVILVLIAFKLLLNTFAAYSPDPMASLALILGILTASVVASVLKENRNEK